METQRWFLKSSWWQGQGQNSASPHFNCQAKQDKINEMHLFATFGPCFLLCWTYFRSFLDFEGIFVNCSTLKNIIMWLISHKNKNYCQYSFWHPQGKGFPRQSFLVFPWYFIYGIERKQYKAHRDHFLAETQQHLHSLILSGDNLTEI